MVPRSRYSLPAPSGPPQRRLLQRGFVFLTSTWRGRVLLGAVAVVVLAETGLPIPGILAGLAEVLVLVAGMFVSLRLLRFASRRLLWRIRSKLILSLLTL